MSDETRERLEIALQHVNASRRDALRCLLVGGGAMVLLAPISQVLAGGAPYANPIAKCVQGKMETFNGLQVFPAGPVKVKMTGRTSVVLTGGPVYTSDVAAMTSLPSKCGATKVTNKVKTLSVKGK
jgi:hypothetical protein